MFFIVKMSERLHPFRIEGSSADGQEESSMQNEHTFKHVSDVSIHVQQTCPVLRGRSTRRVRRDQAIDIVQRGFREARLAVPAVHAGVNWQRDDETADTDTLLVDATLPCAEVQRAITNAHAFELVFRPSPTDEVAEAGDTRVEDAATRRRAAVDVLMTMHIPREGQDCTVGSFRVDEHARLIVSCSHPGYATLDRTPPHRYLGALRIPIVYEHDPEHVTDRAHVAYDFGINDLCPLS